MKLLAVITLLLFFMSFPHSPLAMRFGVALSIISAVLSLACDALPRAFVAVHIVRR
jgi:hypothetical protein